MNRVKLNISSLERSPTRMNHNYKKLISKFYHKGFNFIKKKRKNKKSKLFILNNISKPKNKIKLKSLKKSQKVINQYENGKVIFQDPSLLSQMLKTIKNIKNMEQ